MRKDTTVRTHSNFIRLIGAAVLMLTAAGCGSATQSRFLHPNADLGTIQKVAVLPFENVAEDKSAGEKVSKIFFVELLSLEVFDVSEPGLVLRTLRTQNGTVDTLGPDQFKQLGKDLGVDGLFVGSVIDFAEGRSGATPAPRVTVQLRLVETQTGATIWSASETRSRAAVSTKLFGVGAESLTEAARDVIRRELASLLK